MKNIVSNIRKFKKEHKFLFAALIASWLPGLVLFTIQMILGYKNLTNFNIKQLMDFMYFLTAPITVSIITYIACKTMPKYPELTKWISAILNICIVLYTVLINLFVIFILLSLYFAAWQGLNIFNEPLP